MKEQDERPVCDVAHDWRMMSPVALHSDVNEDLVYRLFECARCGAIKVVAFETSVKTRVVALASGGAR